ncbi:MAG: ABC transporter permease, partial [Thermodesulfobacteriota bacterium]
VNAGIMNSSNEIEIKPVSEVVKDNQQVINEGFLPVLGVLLSISFLIGVMVIGLTIYSAVLEKRREYGILKAIGARTGQMILMVQVQSLAAALAGYGAGLGASFLAAEAAEWWVPQFITRIQLPDLILIGIAAILMGIVSSMIPLQKISRVDPAEVFRS